MILSVWFLRLRLIQSSSSVFSGRCKNSAQCMPPVAIPIPSACPWQVGALRKRWEAGDGEPIGTSSLELLSQSYKVHYQPTWLPKQSELCSLFTLQVELAPRLLSKVVTLARPSVSSSLQITNRSFRYASPYLWNQFLLRSVNLILFSNVILRISPYHLITVTAFALINYHCLCLSLQT